MRWEWRHPLLCHPCEHSPRKAPAPLSWWRRDWSSLLWSAGEQPQSKEDLIAVNCNAGTPSRVPRVKCGPAFPWTAHHVPSSPAQSLPSLHAAMGCSPSHWVTQHQKLFTLGRPVQLSQRSLALPLRICPARAELSPAPLLLQRLHPLLPLRVLPCCYLWRLPSLKIQLVLMLNIIAEFPWRREKQGAQKC